MRAALGRVFSLKRVYVPVAHAAVRLAARMVMQRR